ncbi:MAG TPA: nucleotidyltransferase family protein [Candidatus Mediterraneibacter gallistercoris]|uniref:Nucleotidyltransferase family protein n=1 Tax=Candidatus Mediterraneibacter gallistercoris TaxID=2838671 RepID=A0A9D2P363_9FIRM|nr:nucleotidyltransferase family protein [Candidatus Mediterraneibacter gallistercoris]
MKLNAISEKMLEALRCFLNGEKVMWEDGLSAEDWAELFRLCQHHQILPMIYDTVYACPAFASCPPDLVQMIKGQVIRQVMTQSRKTEEFLQLYGKLTEQGLTPVVVKGIICRSLYREPDYRCSGDEDVLIPAEQFHKCADVFAQNQMDILEPDMNPDEEGEVPYYHVGGMLHIELHKELFSSESEAYGGLNRLFDDVFDRKIQAEVNGVKVYTMCHTDHLLYLILHAFKHFLHSGFGIRQVCDIMIYAEAYGAEIDWDYLLEKCRGIHADVFAATLFDIGKKELNFDPEKACYPQNWAEIEADGGDMLEDLIDGGVFGDSSMSRKHSSNITLQAVSEDKKGKKAGASLIRSLFPDRAYMERTYTYLKKYPFLLPAAWASRIRKYLKESKNMQENDAMASIEIGNHRVDLMKKYKIIQ